ncbi:hypothetical protein BH10ACT3_BH10ACT3_12530 [soil metagenome]
MLRELEEADARRNAIVARSSDLVMFFDLTGTITWASPAASSLFAVEPEDLVGRNGFDQLHPLDRDQVLADFKTITGLGDHVRCEFRVIVGRGQLRWVEEIATNWPTSPRSAWSSATSGT